MNRRIPGIAIAIACLLTFLSPLRAGLDHGSDGSDGVFSPVASIEIDLATAPTGVWTDAGGDVTSDGISDGIYDPQKWAVVFKYASINIPAGVMVTFKNHPSGAPVIWLSQGNVTIEGTVDVSGKAGSGAQAFAEPGPGGFHGGRLGSGAGLTQSSGLGPGGGQLTSTGSTNGAGGGYSSAGQSNFAGAEYGNINALPLIGGSGGGASASAGAGGGGGGAIVVASNTQISLIGGTAIRARGGEAQVAFSGSGAGGAIRLIAPTVTGPASSLDASGPNAGFDGSHGRIRIDADDVLLTGTSVPNYSTDGYMIPVFPPANYPTLRATMVDGEPITTEPVTGMESAEAGISNPGSVTVSIEATNIPVGTVVIVHVIPGRGQRFTVNSTPLADAGGGLLTATASISNFPPGRVELQLRAAW